MTTKTLLTRLALTLCVVAGLARPAVAQTFTHNTTTLAAAVTATDTTVSLTSASAASGSSFGSVAAGQEIFVDQELMLITAISSTTATVQRTGARTAHASLTPVYIGPGNSFQRVDPPAGGCTTANQPKFWINVDRGTIYTCGPNSVWAKGNAPWYGGATSGSGATVTLTPAQSGQTFLFDKADGIVYTLPKPVPGMTFDFFVLTSVTSNAYKVISNASTTFLVGSLVNIDTDSSNAVAAWTADGSTIVSISMNGSTTGGLKGTWFRFTALSATIWLVTGIDQGSSTVATPFATS